MKNKVVLVTGGSSGIGKATALALAQAKAKVVVVADKNEEGLQGLIQEIKSIGEEAFYIKMDVSKEGEVAALVEKIVAKYGRLDCAFNNAGIEGPQLPLHELSEKDWEHLISINLKGVWLCMKYEIAQMLKQGGGAIVNMSSVAGVVGLRGYSSYVAAKHGVIGLTKTAALEYATLGIRVNAICPGAINTPLLDRMIGGNPQIEQWLISQEPVGRLGQPEEIAKAVVWLCSNEASFVTGHSMVVDGGATVQ
ncbi:MAG: SDR family oxidoreductase [Verrucomicrobiae bacterium]|nr:SDR family oxidoreductase [Verrucomicrobiae bacterium]